MKEIETKKFMSFVILLATLMAGGVSDLEIL